jgi:sugar O-acyltransferase (sialic acid O-acetyltransferase NeuD family)
MANRIVVFGCGQIAEIANFYFQHDSDVEVAAFTVDPEFIESTTFCGKPLVSLAAVAERFSPADYGAFVAMSYNGINAQRAAKCRALREIGYELVSYVSSKATVWPGLQAGGNCFILEDNTVQPFVRIGDNVTLWSGNHIGHHSIIEDNVFISSQVVVSGNVVVGANSFLGVNATIQDGIKIGANNVIGAGAHIGANTDDESVFRATPTEKSRVPSSRLRRI